jgi:S1 RNA binding domain protein
VQEEEATPQEASEQPPTQEPVEAPQEPVEAPQEPVEAPQEAVEAPQEATEEEPSQEVEVGAVIRGTVERIEPYGAFLKLPDGRMGLVHISEIDRNYVRDVHEHLRENDRVEAKVIAIKNDGKIDLSIKALQDPAPRRLRRGSDPELEQKLKQFRRQSEERLVDFRRSKDRRR